MIRAGKSSRSIEIANLAVALVFIVAAAAAGYRVIGVPPVVIVGGSGLVALIAWSRTYLQRPVAPEIILPLSF